MKNYENFYAIYEICSICEKRENLIPINIDRTLFICDNCYPLYSNINRALYELTKSIIININDEINYEQQLPLFELINKREKSAEKIVKECLLKIEKAAESQFGPLEKTLVKKSKNK